MAVGYVNSSRSGASDVSGTSCVVPVPTGAAAGHIAVLGMKHWETFDGTGITWPFGFAAITGVNPLLTGNRQKLYAAWKRLTAADTGNYTIAWTSSQWSQGNCVLISGGLASGDPIEGVNTAQGTGTSIPTTSLTIADLAFLLHLVDAENAATQTTPPTGFIEAQDGDYIHVSYRIPVATGSASAAGGVLAASTAKNVALIAIKPEPTGGADQGTLSGSVPAPTGALAAGAKDSATLAGSVASPVGSLAGVAEAPGLLTGTVPAPAAALSGTLRATGTLAGQVPALTGNIGAAAKSAGVLSGQLPTPVGDLAGNLESDGLLAGQMSAPVGSLAATAEATGSLAATIAPPSGSLTATIRDPGALAGSVPAPVASLVGAAGGGAGLLTGQMPQPIGVLSGQATAAGTAAGQVPALVGSIAASSLAAGALSGSLPAPVGSLTGLSAGPESDFQIPNVGDRKVDPPLLVSGEPMPPVLGVRSDDPPDPIWVQ